MSSRRARRLYSVATLVCLALLGAAPVGNAASGVRLDLGAIQVDEALLPGGSYQLPVIGVGNPGDEAAAYRMDVVALDGMAGQPIPAAWIRFEPQRFTLEAGGHVAVRAFTASWGVVPGLSSRMLKAGLVKSLKGMDA